MNPFGRMIFAAWFVALNAGAAAAASAAIEPMTSAGEQLQKLRQEMHLAHAAGNAGTYLDGARAMRVLLNASPNSVLQLMSAEAFAGKQQDALRSFDEFVRMGQSNDAVLQSTQFDAVRSAPQYSIIHAAMIANNAAISSAAPMYKLREPALIPEDIDYDAAARLFYITSVLKKLVLAVEPSGRTRVFARAPDGWPMLALKIDAGRGLLWATEVAMDGYAFSPSKDWGRSAILIYDLKSGHLIHRIEGPPTASLGDMTLTAEGDAIVSDGEHGGIYKVERTTRRIERLDAGDFISPQTAAAPADGLHLFVPDYVRGIGVLDLKTKRVAWIPTKGMHALSGIDGLYLAGQTLLATQNGTTPERVIRFRLNAAQDQIESESIIERATPTLGDPTHGVVVGEQFYYIANSGWDSLDEHGNVKPGRTLSEAVVMRVPI